MRRGSRQDVKLLLSRLGCFSPSSGSLKKANHLFKLVPDEIKYASPWKTEMGVACSADLNCAETRNSDGVNFYSIHEGGNKYRNVTIKV